MLSSNNPKQSTSFIFRIDDVFDLKNSGVVVTGQVTEGVLHQGETVGCIPTVGIPFLCTIDAIEQPDPLHQGQYLYPSEARADGPLEGHYALQIPDLGKSYFHSGDRLIPAVPASKDETQETTSNSCETFLFQIEHIFRIQNIGTALVGVVLNGSAGIGDEVSFGNVPGEALFSCKIKAIDGKESIEGGIHPVECATADGSCCYGCALILDEPNSDRFQPKGYLFIP